MMILLLFVRFRHGKMTVIIRLKQKTMVIMLC